MATTVALVGGPCDGTTRNVRDSTLKAGHLTCKGADYIRTDAIHVGDLITFATKQAIANVTGGSPTPADNAAQALGGWSDLRKQTNQTIPTAVRRMRATQNAALRELRHGRRVKR